MLNKNGVIITGLRWPSWGRQFCPWSSAAFWLLIPQSIKDLISSLVDMGIMVLIMYVMMQVMKPLSAAVAPKQVKAAPAPPSIKEAKT